MTKITRIEENVMTPKKRRHIGSVSNLTSQRVQLESHHYLVNQLLLNLLINTVILQQHLKSGARSTLHHL